MKRLIGFVLPLLTYSAFAQVSINWIANLNTEIKETSGLAFVNNRLITHNDSGGKAALYEIDTTSGAVMRTVYVANATNVDWEDIASDQNFIYIGDFGNNNGSRTNLKIYKISISDYLSTVNDTVLADTISFSYADQTDFTPASMATKYDAEALVSFSDSLYLFTKNWVDSISYVYQIPKTPGTYSVSIVDSIYTRGLITGADISTKTNTLILCGYIGVTPFVSEVDSLQFPFSKGQQVHTIFPVNYQYSRQTEGICTNNSRGFFLSAEAFLGKSACLLKLDKSTPIGISETQHSKISVYPNPANKIIHLDGARPISVLLYNASGKLLISSTAKEIDTSILKAGHYTLLLIDMVSGETLKEKLIIH